mmetsp:Transcript_68834/g.190592  ORF Transcript_68834/g.190592 Transcript_68834/m.190592 type:complete len:255 (+) Transcript_68834:506-1270(+)
MASHFPSGSMHKPCHLKSSGKAKGLVHLPEDAFNWKRKPSASTTSARPARNAMAAGGCLSGEPSVPASLQPQVGSASKACSRASTTARPGSWVPGGGAASNAIISRSGASGSGGLPHGLPPAGSRGIPWSPRDVATQSFPCGPKSAARVRAPRQVRSGPDQLEPGRSAPPAPPTNAPSASVSTSRWPLASQPRAAGASHGRGSAQPSTAKPPGALGTATAVGVRATAAAAPLARASSTCKEPPVSGSVAEPATA